MYIHPIPFAILVFFALTGFYLAIRKLIDWKTDTKRQFEKYKRFYNAIPKGGKRNIEKFDETEIYN